MLMALNSSVCSSRSKWSQHMVVANEHNASTFTRIVKSPSQTDHGPGPANQYFSGYYEGGTTGARWAVWLSSGTGCNTLNFRSKFAPRMSGMCSQAVSSLWAGQRGFCALGPGC